MPSCCLALKLPNIELLVEGCLHLADASSLLAERSETSATRQLAMSRRRARVVGKCPGPFAALGQRSGERTALAVRQFSFFQFGHASMPAGVEREQLRYAINFLAQLLQRIPRPID